MKTKLLVSIVSCLAVVLFLTSFASAINQQTYDQMDFMSKLSYNLRNGLGLFTTWGQSNCCSDNPDKEGALFTNDVVRCTDKCSYNKCAIDIFIQGYNSDGSVNVYKTFEGETTTGSYTNTQVTKKWYQIYCCPSTCGTGFHTTPIYDCLNGQWVSKGGVLKTDPLRWCSDGTQKNYKDQDGNVHCASSPSSAWCPAVTCTPNWQCGSWSSCSAGTQTRTCTDLNSCGVSTGKPATSQSCSSGGEVCPLDTTFGVCSTVGQTKCDSGYKTLECVSYNSGFCWRLKDICTSGCNQGCETGGNDSNIGEGGGEGKSITLSEFYSITDEDFSDYVRACKIHTDCSSIEGYTVSCINDGSFYNQAQKRYFRYVKSQCEISPFFKLSYAISRFFIGTDICSFGSNVIISAGDWWSNNLGSGTGICLAKSDKWYLKIWEQVLTIVGGLGLPSQYVSIISIIILLGAVSTILRTVIR